MRLARVAHPEGVAFVQVDGREGAETAREIEDHPFGNPTFTGRSWPLADTRLLAPILPSKVVAIGRNYADHAAELGNDVPSSPIIFIKPSTSVIGPRVPIQLPASSERVDYEGELAVVIGKKAKHLTEANAMSCVFGYTIGNDVSERTWQKADRGLWRSKNADTFKPMGPWIETDVDLDKMETVIRVNGNETGRFHTNDMIFGVVPFLVELSKYFTLSPGDVIWMGTDGASPNLKAGDVVEIDITGIGTLRNRFVAEKV